MTHAVHSITNSCFLSLPIDVAHCILSGLDVKSLIQFEKTYPGHASLTQRAWTYHRTQDFFLFDWSFLDNHPQAHKWSYVLSKLLIKHEIYFQWIQDKDKKIAAAKKYQTQWNHLIKKFPLWGRYIEEDLSQILGKKDEQESSLWRYSSAWGSYIITHFSPFSSKETPSKETQGQWGGDLLLQGLFEVKKLDLFRN